ncbi:uncharacterized protein LOC129742822 [Uranotaenia lowii]|uniref:uncharacterized protein LOC129742822 n=1 Tax=Uranotaenia lowii TaxID=190385 RepID=UPI00247923A1|nr:uncharacterized protein LOC129742822 [Uranotaenia lowii]
MCLLLPEIICLCNAAGSEGCPDDENGEDAETLTSTSSARCRSADEAHFSTILVLPPEVFYRVQIRRLRRRLKLFMGIIQQPLLYDNSVPTATIIGGPDLHVDKGSTINLTCAVKYSPEPPAYIFWYHHDEVISYDSSRGGVSVITEKGDITTSHLLIQNADLDDSGKYSCSPSNADVASVRVHVLNGEHPEAMQTGAATRVTSPSERRRHFVVILLVTALLTFYRWLTMGGCSQALAATALLKVSPASSSGRGLSTATSTDHHFSRWWSASAKTSSTIRGRQRPASEAAGHPDQRFQNHGNGNGGQLRECCPTNLRWSSR